MKTKMKRMRNLILLSFMLFNFPLVQGQEFTQTLKGKITDAETQVPLPGAYVILAGSDPIIGAITDANGNYVFSNMPIGRESFRVTYIGYEDVFFNDVHITTGQEVVLNVKMREAINTMDEIVITPDDILSEPINSMATVSSMRLTVDATSRIAAGINDPSRTVQSYAGVSSADDENNEIIVRGNSPRGMLWRMEGIEIPNPNHFSDGEGATGGGVSILSTQVLDDSDFLTGAFPAEYGNALSSVFDLQLRTGNFDKREYAFQVGVMGLQASLEGPFSKNSEASYLLNYRYSTTSFLNQLGFIIGDSDVFPEWQDLSLNINLPTKRFGRFNIWGIGGISSSAELPVADSANWEFRGDAYGYTEKHDLALAGVTHNYLFKNNKSYIKTVATLSYTNNEELEDSLSYDLVPTLINNEAMEYKTITASTMLNHKFNVKNIMRIGAVYTHQAFDLLAKDFNYEDEILEKQLEQKGATDRFQAYFQWKLRLGSSLELNAGVHHNYVALTKDYSVEPRLGAKWRINDKHILSYGFGAHSRAETASIYLAEQEQPDGSIIHPNTDLKMTKAIHNVIGYNWRFGPDFHFRIEAYYQHLYEVPIQLEDTTGTFSALNFRSGFTNTNLTNQGTGRNYGVELTLEKFFSRNYYFLTTASLFQSKYTMPDGIERNTAFNNKYIFNVVGGKEFLVGKNKHNIIGTNLRMIWKGGYPIVPVDLEASVEEGSEVRDYDRAFEETSPDYFRLDIGVSYRKNNPKWSWILSLDIQNVTGRLNVYNEYYDAESESINQVYMTGLIPVLNYKVQF